MMIPSPPVDHFATLVTPPGPAGIAVIQLCGPQIFTIIGQLFQGRQTPAANGRLYHGNIVDKANGIILDEVVLACYPAATGRGRENLVEICCHGGKSVTAAMLALFERSGIKICGPEKWQARFLAIGTIEQAALALFLNSNSELGARLFLYQFQGCLRQALLEIQGSSSHDLEQAKTLAARLIATARLGKVLANPPYIVIAGETNVGKSTLLNALLGHERVLVDAQPGTTRDAVCEPIVLHGIPFYCTDTAGFRATDDPIETMGIAVTQRTLAHADLILWVVDGTRPLATLAWQEVLPQAKTIIVINKSDQAGSYHPEYLARFPGSIAISALTGIGLDALRGQIVSDLELDLPAVPTPIIFTAGQEAILRNALAALEERNGAQAQEWIGKLLE